MQGALSGLGERGAGEALDVHGLTRLYADPENTKTMRTRHPIREASLRSEAREVTLMAVFLLLVAASSYLHLYSTLWDGGLRLWS